MDELRAVDPGNRVCADCNFAGPDWCSLNLGVVLCIDCSGVHRSLGTDVSKVRSLVLDTVSFTPETIDPLKKIGNTRANSVWEAKLNGIYEASGRDFETVLAGAAPIRLLPKLTIPPETDPAILFRKPLATDRRDVKQRFVYAKYIERRFLDAAASAWLAQHVDLSR